MYGAVGWGGVVCGGVVAVGLGWHCMATLHCALQARPLLGGVVRAGSRCQGKARRKGRGEIAGVFLYWALVGWVAVGGVVEWERGVSTPHHGGDCVGGVGARPFQTNVAIDEWVAVLLGGSVESRRPVLGGPGPDPPKQMLRN